MHAKQRKILYIIGGTLAVGGILFHILRRRSKRCQSDPDHVEFSPKELKEVPLPSVPAEDRVSADAHVNVEIEESNEGKHVFENIGASIVLPPQWKIAEDISPIPNVAMISISNINYSPKDGPGQMPGSSPVLVLSVEDNSLEGLDLEEFKEKSKQTAMQQMYMMTNGMVPPRILFDGPQSNGDFEMVLEYALETTMFQIRVINFITMRDELAYVFQFMGNGEVFEAEIDSVREIVRDFSIVPIPSAGPASLTKVCNAELAYSIDLPVNWIIESRKSEALGDFFRVLALTTASPVKTERVELIKSPTGAFDETALRSIASLDKATGITVFTAGKKDTKSAAVKKYNLFVENGISVMEYKNVSAHHVLVFATGEFALRITPLRSQKTIIRLEILYGILQSLTSDAAQSSAVYINNRNGFSFPIKESSRVVESRVGDNTVTFAPEGIRPELLESINSMKPNDQSFEPMPIFTVRCGDPSTDKDCEKTHLPRALAGREYETCRLWSACSAPSGFAAMSKTQEVIVPRSFTLLAELEDAEKSKDNPMMSYGLAKPDDITLTDWNAVVIIQGREDVIFLNFTISCGPDYPNSPPTVTFTGDVTHAVTERLGITSSSRQLSPRSFAYLRTWARNYSMRGLLEHVRMAFGSRRF